MLIPEWNGIRVLESQADFGLWADVQAGSIGFELKGDQRVAWGGDLADMDLDGDLDAVVAFGFVSSDNATWSNSFTQPDSLYLRTPTGDFVDMGLSWDVADTTVGRGFVTCDLNRDGYLDIAKRNLAGSDVLFMSNCGDNNWLILDLKQPDTGNTHAIGAVVDLMAGGLSMRRWMMAGGLNYASSPPPELHFGLGANEVADEVRVTWPDGALSTFSDVPARQRLTITRD
jgi:hypothetical protein